LKDAINEALRDWVTNVDTTYYLLGSALGPHPYPLMVRDFQSVIGTEARAQMLSRVGRLPDMLVAAIGGDENGVHAADQTAGCIDDIGNLRRGSDVPRIAGIIAPTLFTRAFAAVTDAHLHDAWAGITFGIASLLVGIGWIIAWRTTAHLPATKHAARAPATIVPGVVSEADDLQVQPVADRGE
jgi:hypothetical protein